MATNSPNLIPLDFFGWRYSLEESLYTPPMPQNLDESKVKIHGGCESPQCVDWGLLNFVYEEEDPQLSFSKFLCDIQDTECHSLS